MGYHINAKAFDNCLGFRDVDQELRPDPDTVFNFGSMCKEFLALADACLVTDGEIRWDGHVRSFRNDLRHNDVGSPTIWDLLSNRTGLCRSAALSIGP